MDKFCTSGNNYDGAVYDNIEDDINNEFDDKMMIEEDKKMEEDDRVKFIKKNEFIECDKKVEKIQLSFIEETTQLIVIV